MTPPPPLELFENSSVLEGVGFPKVDWGRLRELRVWIRKRKRIWSDGGQTDKWTDRQTEFPLVHSTPVRGRVKILFITSFVQFPVFNFSWWCILQSTKKNLAFCFTILLFHIIADYIGLVHPNSPQHCAKALNGVFYSTLLLLIGGFCALLQRGVNQNQKKPQREMDIEYSYGCVYYNGFDIITMDVYHFTFTPLYNSRQM